MIFKNAEYRQNKCWNEHERATKNYKILLSGPLSVRFATLRTHKGWELHIETYRQT